MPDIVFLPPVPCLSSLPLSPYSCSPLLRPSSVTPPGPSNPLPPASIFPQSLCAFLLLLFIHPLIPCPSFSPSLSSSSWFFLLFLLAPPPSILLLVLFRPLSARCSSIANESTQKFQIAPIFLSGLCNFLTLPQEQVKG